MLKIKISLISALMITSTLSFSTQAKVKEFDLKSTIQNITLVQGSRYKVEFTSYASNYYADKKFHACLAEALKNKKAVTFKATAKKNEITFCKVVK